MSTPDRTLTLPVVSKFGPRDIALLVLGRRSVKQEDQATILDTSRPTIISSTGRLYAKLGADGMVDAVMTAYVKGIMIDADDDLSDEDLRAYFAAGMSWGAATNPATPKQAKSTPAAPKPATKPRKRRSGKVTTRKATPSESRANGAAKVAAAKRAKDDSGVAPA